MRKQHRRVSLALATVFCTIGLGLSNLNAELIAFSELRDGGDGTIAGDTTGEG